MRIWVKEMWKFFALFWQLFCTFKIISKIIKLYTHTHILLPLEMSQDTKLPQPNFKNKFYFCYKHIKIIKIKKKNLLNVAVLLVIKTNRPMELLSNFSLDFFPGEGSE